MVYYWKCKIHNEVMMERLDKTKTKIIPYCSHCECKKELEEIISYLEKEYQRELKSNELKYQKECEEYQKELLQPRYKKELPFYLIGLIILGVGLLNVYFGLSYNGISQLWIGIVGSLFIIILSVGLYFSKPTEPIKTEIKKPQVPYITTIYDQKVDLFKSLQAEVDQYKAKLKRQYDNQTVSVYEMNEIDNMDGFEFEEYVARLLKNLGYVKTYVTKKSGDLGADVIAVDSKNVKVAIQCKRYGIKNYVGNNAIQQIHTAKDYYDCHKAIVITTSYFTKTAFQMAQKLGVELWNRKTLKEKISSIGKENWNNYLSKYYITPTLEKVDYIKIESV